MPYGFFDWMIESWTPKECSRQYLAAKRKSEAKRDLAIAQAKYGLRARRADDRSLASKPAPKTPVQEKPPKTMVCTCRRRKELPLTVPCPCGRQIRLVSQINVRSAIESSSDSDSDDTRSESSRASSNGEKSKKKAADKSKNSGPAEKSAQEKPAKEEKMAGKSAPKQSQKESKHVNFDLKSSMKEGRKTALPGTINKDGDQSCRDHCWCPECFKARWEEKTPPHDICAECPGPGHCIHRGRTIYTGQLEKRFIGRESAKQLAELRALLFANSNRASPAVNNNNRNRGSRPLPNQNQTRTQSSSNTNSSNLNRNGFHDLSDARIQAIKNNLYRTNQYPTMGRILRPVQASVVLREDVLETPNDPRPNAFIDMNTGVVRVYHGPVYGNPYSSIVPTQQPLPVGSTSISTVPPFLAGPQNAYASNNRMYGGLAPMPGSQQAWGGPPDFQGQGQGLCNNNGWGSGPGFANQPGWNNTWGGQNNWEGPGQGRGNGQARGNGQGRNQNSPNPNQNNATRSSRNNSPAQAQNSPIQSNTAKVRNSSGANNNARSPPVDNNGWATVTPQQADDMATGVIPGSWGCNEQSGGGDWNAPDTSNDTTNSGGGWGDDNAGQTTGQASGNGGDAWGSNDNADTSAQDNSGTSGWNQGSSAQSVGASWGAVDLTQQSNDNSWGGDAGDTQTNSGNNNNSWGGASGNDEWNAGFTNAQPSGTDSWGANTGNNNADGGNNGGGSGWGAGNNDGGSGPVNYNGFGGVGAASGGNSSNPGNWATDSGLSAGSWAEGTGPTLGSGNSSNAKKTDGW